MIIMIVIIIIHIVTINVITNIVLLLLLCAAGSGLAADISLGAANGAAAVQYVCQMVAAAPPLRVLVLVIKALLKVSPA